eukprot:CAMPEP_0170458898 /NCGR_PEP_ID=MMETSP0123-20130129/5733_1 /TAXON_ID=182087 /ORGANISM="Favella ehrenbergii, Strain Fehren 1" /LENGTH=125 /DNA_ID=CAMNT_0010723237 /DNA_START=260 /DNA_END=634 /DNA_ORIENTATION=-
MKLDNSEPTESIFFKREQERDSNVPNSFAKIDESTQYQVNGNHQINFSKDESPKESSRGTILKDLLEGESIKNDKSKDELRSNLVPRPCFNNLVLEASLDESGVYSADSARIVVPQTKEKSRQQE